MHQKLHFVPQTDVNKAIQLVSFNTC